MARLPRLVLPDVAHYLIQRAHGSRPAFTDDEDRAAFLTALQHAATIEGVRVHAWALLPDEIQLIVTPGAAPALGRMMQALGRSYVSAYNRRHGCTGTLWSGRYRCAPIEAGEPLLHAMQLVDAQSNEAGWTSAGHRLGQRSGVRVAPVLSELPEFWALGNTPFEREAAYRAQLANGLTGAEALALRQAALGGWAIGSEAFAVAAGAAAGDRPARPRPRGRPRRAPG